MTYNEVLSNVKIRKFSPVYFFHGEEPFYIDKLIDTFQSSVLTADEKEFNQTVFYGRDATTEHIISAARRYPMMAEYNVVIIREAQDLGKKLDELDAYIKQVNPTTIFCIGYKGKVDKRKAIVKKLIKAGEVVESKPLYDNQVPNWIQDQVKQHGLKITIPAALLLSNQLGSNLHKLDNALSKLVILCGKGAEITPLEIEKNIGISKDFNVFEFVNAIGSRNKEKAYQIASYFAANPKAGDPIFIVTQLFTFFSKLMALHYLPNKGKAQVASALKVNPFFVDQYLQSAKHYNAGKVVQNVGYLREYDMKFKGKGSGSINKEDLLKELCFKIMN
jgi:DNA polymerase-3 subunit delta